MISAFRGDRRPHTARGVCAGVRDGGSGGRTVKYKVGSPVLRDGVHGRVVRCLWLIDIAEQKPMQPAYEVQFTDGRRLILRESELSVYQEPKS